jgi:hypothetical protein
MVSVMAYQRTFSELIEMFAHLKNLHVKMEELELDSSVFSMQWLVCLFTCTLNENVIIRKLWIKLIYLFLFVCLDCQCYLGLFTHRWTYYSYHSQHKSPANFSRRPMPSK